LGKNQARPVSLSCQRHGFRISLHTVLAVIPNLIRNLPPLSDVCNFA